jgi:hypothetical protein
VDLIEHGGFPVCLFACFLPRPCLPIDRTLSLWVRSRPVKAIELFLFVTIIAFSHIENTLKNVYTVLEEKRGVCVHCHIIREMKSEKKKLHQSEREPFSVRDESFGSHFIEWYLCV